MDEEYVNNDEENHLNIDPSEVYKSNLDEIYSIEDIQNWLLNYFYNYVYVYSSDKNTFIDHNHFLGENRIRISMRKIELLKNKRGNVNKTISLTRDTT